MKNAIIDMIINKLRIFNYATELPVILYYENKYIFSIPEKLVTSDTILKKDELIKLTKQSEKGTLIIENKYKETMIVNNNQKDNISIIVGPVLTAKIEQGTITNLTRDKVIPLHQKSNMQTYYNNLTVIGNDKLFYTGKLLETIISSIAKDNITEDKIEYKQNNKDETYYIQKKDNRSNAFLHAPYVIEKEISKLISNGDIENAKLVLKELNETPHAKLASNTIRSYKNSMICSCAIITRAAIAGGVNPDDAFTLSDTYINEIENIKEIKELESFEIKMVEGFTNKVIKVKNNRYSKAVLDAIFYIDNHLCDDIKIKDIASSVYLNPSYLSNLFHKETGKTLNEWIKRKRIEEASYFVLNSNENIADIAFFYRFSTQSYFINCFKKIMGITPGEYRNRKTNLN